jgi:hypothetical protein
MPAYTLARKGSTKIPTPWHHYWDDISVSDSDGDPQRTADWYICRYQEGLNTKHHTRLEQDLFDWLHDWCLENSNKIETQRLRDRRTNEPTVRKLAQDLKDIEYDITKTCMSLADQKKRKRQMKRKLIVLVDETPVVENHKSLLTKKLLTFCRIMALPPTEFDCERYPRLDGDKMLTEPEAVK